MKILEIYLILGCLLSLLGTCIIKDYSTFFILSILLFNSILIAFDSSLILVILLSFTLLFFFLLYFNYKFADLYDVYLYYAILFAVLGLIFAINSSNLISLYLGIELYSISNYMLVSYGRNEKNIKAGLYYFILNSLYSGFLALGFSLIYLSTGDIYFEPISRFKSMLLSFDFGLDYYSYNELLYSIGVYFIMSVLLFKIGSAPFHYWLPDIYSKVKFRIAGYLLTIPKLGYIYLIYLVLTFLGIHNTIQLLMLASFLSLFFGSLLGLIQLNLRRLFVYSSIKHIGFILAGLFTININIESFTNSWVYVIVYSISTINLIGCLFTIRSYFRLEWIDELRGLYKSNPFLAFVLSLTLLSMAGIPPLIGFYTKLLIYFNLVNSGNYFFLFSCAISSVISAAYYIKIIKTCYFSPRDKNIGLITFDSITASIIALITLGFIFCILNFNLYFNFALSMS